jgi:2-dehydro-3-deoxyphosphooctonate aldolase (KDO 8-P synthase)
MEPVCIGAGVAIGPGRPLALIAGPCVVEDDATMHAAARALGEMCGELALPLVFKSSYEKDNRTDGAADRGPGLVAGLAALSALAAEHRLATTTDVHRVADVAPAAAAVDLVQIPALLCRQSSLLEAAGACGRPVNVKKGQFMSARAIAGSLDKARAAGADGRVLVTERGSSFGPERLVVDFGALPALRALGAPLVVDAGHAANAREEIEVLARAAVAAGADALFIECHPDPARARCDGARMLSLGELARLLAELAPLARLVRSA